MAWRIVRGVNVRDLCTYLLRHPQTAPVVTLAAWRLRRRAWWRRAPFLPLPSSQYWEFRMATANGSSGAPMTGRAVVEAATWSQRQRAGR
jgi:hypothetical protein